MKESETLHELLHVICAVPVRRTNGRIEFCIVHSDEENSWEFPKTVWLASMNDKAAALTAAAAENGLAGLIFTDRPISEFSYARGGRKRAVAAYLMEVSDPTAPDERLVRRWCSAEEGRKLIRRKPLRRLLDVVLRSFETGPKSKV